MKEQKRYSMAALLLIATVSLAIFAGDPVSLTVTREKASEHGNWDPVGENAENRYINVSAGAEVKLVPKTVKTVSAMGVTDIKIQNGEDTDKICNTACTIQGADIPHKLHRRGRYKLASQGGAGGAGAEELVWNASGRTEDYDVRLEYMDNQPVKTAQFDTLTNDAKLIIEGDLQGKKIKLVGNGVDITDPDKEYTASADFTFKPNRISAAQDDLSISAVEVGNESNVWSKVTLMSYLYYKPAAQPCLMQRKDTNAVCEKCPEPADLVNHDSDKPHPDDYNEIHKCKHCNSNCGRAVVVTMGKKKSQDEVFRKNSTTLTENHGIGVFPRNLDYLIVIQEETYIQKQAYAKSIYIALKASRKLYSSWRDNHARLLWGIAMNDSEGKITETPSFWVSDPSDQGTKFFSASDSKGVYK